MTEPIVQVLLTVAASIIGTHLIQRRLPRRERSEDAVLANAASDISASAAGLTTHLYNEIKRQQDAFKECEGRLIVLEVALRQRGVDPDGLT